MTSYPVRLLCLVDEQALLHCRRAVLKSPGYDAQTARLSEVKLLLRIGKKFDLVIVSAGSSEITGGPHSFCCWRDAQVRIGRG
jgi:hypothetical protein